MRSPGGDRRAGIDRRAAIRPAHGAARAATGGGGIPGRGPAGTGRTGPARAATGRGGIRRPGAGPREGPRTGGRAGGERDGGAGTRPAAAGGAGWRRGTVGGSANPWKTGTSAPPRAPPAPAPRRSRTPPGIFPDFGFAPDRLGARLRERGGGGLRTKVVRGLLHTSGS